MIDQVTKNQEDVSIVEISPEQKQQLSRLGLLLRGFLIADVALILFLTFGLVFPSKIQPKEPDAAMPESYYNMTAKQSPLDVPDYSARAPRNKPPLISARTLPLTQVPVSENSVLPVLNTNYMPGAPMTPGQAANTESDMTTLRKRTTL